MEKSKKPVYNMWQNTGYMLRLAWEDHKIIPVLGVLIAVFDAAKAAAELLLAPMVLAEIEQAAPLGTVLRTIAAFGAALLVLACLLAYIRQNTRFARSDLRLHTLAQRLAEKLTSTSYPNTLDVRFNELKSKASNTIVSIWSPAEEIWAVWTTLLTDLLGFALYLALLSQCSILLMVITTVTAVAGYFAGRRIEEWSYRHRREEEASLIKMDYLEICASARAYAKDIRIFSLQRWLLKLWDNALHAYRDFIGRRETMTLWAGVVDTALALVRSGAAYAVLLWITLSQGLPASQFLLYFTAISGFTRWVTGILDGFSTLHRQSLDLCALREFLDWPEPFQFAQGEPVPATPDGRYELRLEDVSYRYPDAKEDTISHMNLTIRPGEKLAIVGLNGAGKTTLVKLLCGFLDPCEGRVLLNGADIRQYDRREVYRKFAGVFQEFSILEATIAENVAQRVEGIDTARVREVLRAAGFEEKVDTLPKGLDTHIGREIFEDGIELSGGETQRLMLARALYKDAPLLILDEPTAALDPLAENDIYRKYNEMTKNKTAVFISHRLASTRFCDRILFLEKGRIAEEGTHDSLLKQGGGYAELFEVQSKYYREGAEHEK